jgi:hypothetical protein
MEMPYEHSVILLIYLRIPRALLMIAPNDCTKTANNPITATKLIAMSE